METKKRNIFISVASIALALVLVFGALGFSFASTPQQDDAVYVALTLSENTRSESQPQLILTDVSDIVEAAMPSVVSITSRSLLNYYGNNFGFYGGNGNLDDFFNYFFGDSYGGRGSNRSRGYEEIEVYEDDDDDENVEEVESGLGSGTIIAQNDTELLILTSYHVVEDSSSLYVTFIDDSSVDGYIKSADEDNDIAIVAIPLEDIEKSTLDSIKVATISTQEPQVGDGVIVIGNALGYGLSVTTGIVSALDRDIYVEGKTLTVLQTDAAINSGNSGGCMLNSNGEIIGINEAKVKLSYVEGMCYAIPVASNLDLIEKLVNAEGTFEENQNNGRTYSGAFLGIRGRDVTSDISDNFGMPLGVYVSSTVMGSGAEEAGIQNGDIIIGIDDTDISTMEELQNELADYEAGDTVTLIVNRMLEGNYETLEIDVTLTDRIS